MERKSNIKYWMILVISSLLASGAIGITINAVGVFYTPVSSGLGVLQGEFAMHTTLGSLGIAVASFFIPRVLNRIDFRKIILAATLIVAATTVGMSFSTKIWHFNILGLIRGIASAFYGIVPLQILINNWFVKRHGLTTSIVLSFSGVAGAIFSPIFASIIESGGWRFAYLVKAAILVAVSLPAILYPFKINPRDEGLLPYGDGGNARNVEKTLTAGKFNYFSTTFIMLVIASIFITGITGMSQHLPAIGSTLGLKLSAGAFMASACMLGNIIFKLLIGVLSDWGGPIKAVFTMIIINTLGLILILMGINEWLVYLGSFLFGAVYAVGAVGFVLLVKLFFKPEYFQRILPILTFVSNVGAAFAVSLYGYSYDFTGDYILGLIASIVINVAAVIMLSIANFQAKKTRLLSDKSLNNMSSNVS